MHIDVYYFILSSAYEISFALSYFSDLKHNKCSLCDVTLNWECMNLGMYNNVEYIMVIIENDIPNGWSILCKRIKWSASILDSLFKVLPPPQKKSVPPLKISNPFPFNKNWKISFLKA